MNRRQFHTAMLATGASAALPLPMPAAAKAAAKPPLYAWAAAIARVQNRASPGLLAQQLKISHAAASGLYSALLRDGVIRAAQIGTLATAVQPTPLTQSARAGAPLPKSQGWTKLWKHLTAEPAKTQVHLSDKLPPEAESLSQSDCAAPLGPPRPCKT